MDIRNGNLILEIIGGFWDGHYMSWNPAEGTELTVIYPPPQGSSFRISSFNGKHVWWAL